MNRGFFMSIARIGTRASVVGLGVLASLAFTAAPSWAGGGNSANAALCEEGGYPGVLLAQDGTAFKNTGECASYGAQGGQVAGVNAAAEPSVGGTIQVSFSGFGLKPGTEVSDCAKYTSASVNGCPRRLPTVAADGKFAEELGFDCEFEGSTLTFLSVQATTASGTLFERRFPPSGC
jgi:hypothetical protein